MKRYLVLAVVLAVVIAVALVWRSIHSEWKLVENVTGFHFPKRTLFLAQYDNAEWYVVSVAKIPELALASFADGHGFRPGADSDLLHTTGALPEKYRIIPTGAQVLFSSGKTEYNSWEAVLDSKSGLLWIVVTYPDMAGDHSGTAPQPKMRTSDR